MISFLISRMARAAQIVNVPIKLWLYRKGPIWNLIQRVVRASTPDGVLVFTMQSGELAGRKMRLHYQNHKPFWTEDYERDVPTAILALAKPGMVAYDIGANIGYHSLLLATLAGTAGKVFSFEPLPSNVDWLRHNLLLNADLNKELIPKAVSNHVGESQLLVHRSITKNEVEGSDGYSDSFEDRILVPGL